MAENNYKIVPVSFRATERQAKDIDDRAKKSNMNRSMFILKSLSENGLAIIDKRAEICFHLCNISTEINKIKMEYPAADITKIVKEFEDSWHILT
jgi:hypothetical protein